MELRATIPPLRRAIDRAAWLTGRSMILGVRAYQFGIRPLLIGRCKFCPSCSEYCIESIERHGPLRGGWLGLRRLLRCHPFSTGGIDPVPAE
jgi:putative membrane protein insertion efficiency factor